MAETKGYTDLIAKLKAYKKKYYQNKLIKGSLLAFAILISAYLVVNSLEYTVRFGSLLRGLLLFGYILVAGWTLYYWVINPISKLFSLNRSLSDEEAATQIGRYFPSVQDKLLNTLQLHRLSIADNALIQASIVQKTNEVAAIPFVNAISFKENRKYAKYLVFPAVIMAVLLLAAPQLFTESTPRLINFTKTYAPVAPFDFNILNSELQAFKNEDFNLKLGFTGEVTPNTVYLQTKDRRVKMTKADNGLFEFKFSKVQEEFDFQFEAEGFESQSYHLNVRSRPNLKSFDIDLVYPKYLQKQNESLRNTGNLQIPEGTNVTWTFEAVATETIEITFDSDSYTHLTLPTKIV